MTNKNFTSSLITQLIDEGYETRKNTNRDKINWYTQYFSAINQQSSAEIYDIYGGQIWITIPCNIPGYEDFFFQLDVRNFDKIEFKANPELVLDSIVCQVFFIYNWQNLGVYYFLNNDYGPKKGKLCKLCRRYINESFGANKHWKHFNPSMLLSNVIVRYLIPQLSEFINNPKNVVEGFEKIKKTKSKSIQYKEYSHLIKPIFKSNFKDYFSIR